jgi:hypothetical protein
MISDLWDWLTGSEAGNGLLQAGEPGKLSSVQEIGSFRTRGINEAAPVWVWRLSSWCKSAFTRWKTWIWYMWKKAEAENALPMKSWASAHAWELPLPPLFVPSGSPGYWTVLPIFRAGLFPSLLSHMPIISRTTLTDTPRSVLYRFSRCCLIQSSWQPKLNVTIHTYDKIYLLN